MKEREIHEKSSHDITNIAGVTKEEDMKKRYEKSLCLELDK